MADIVEARKGFQTYVGGAPYRVRSGARYWADDPIVKEHPELFGDITVEQSPSVSRQARLAKVLAETTETADAAPGSRRDRTVPDPGVSAGDPNPQGSDAPVVEDADSVADGTKDSAEDVDTSDASKPAGKRRTPASRPGVDTGKTKPGASGGKAGSDA